jgi:hypothetical protein
VGGGEGAAEEGGVATWRACCKVRQAFMLEVSRPQMCFAVPEVVGKMISQVSATSQQGGWEIDGRAPDTDWALEPVQSKSKSFLF